MKKQNLMIKIWGCRGSLPVSGRKYIKYGGDTTALHLSYKDTNIILDAGTGIRRMGHAVKGKDFHLLFSHFHYDHIIGFPFFAPLYDKNTKINIYAGERHSSRLDEILADTMRSPYFPVPFTWIKSQIQYKNISYEPFYIDDMKIRAIPLNHPNLSMGFIFEFNEKKFAFITDHELNNKIEDGLDYDSYVELFSGSDILIHDAMYTDKEYKTRKLWGHSTYNDTIRLLRDSESKKLVFFHHAPERTDQHLEEIRKDLSEDILIAYQDMELIL